MKSKTELAAEKFSSQSESISIDQAITKKLDFLVGAKWMYEELYRIACEEDVSFTCILRFQEIYKQKGSTNEETKVYTQNQNH